MSELIITNDARQLVITRLACINSAVSVVSLLHGQPRPPLRTCCTWRSAWRRGRGEGSCQKPPRLKCPRYPHLRPRRTRRRPLRPLSVGAGQGRLPVRNNGKPCMPSASAEAWTARRYRPGCSSSWGRRSRS
jgi:hypothetical protein